jgi:hypothetical protein
MILTNNQIEMLTSLRQSGIPFLISLDDYRETLKSNTTQRIHLSWSNQVPCGQVEVIHPFKAFVEIDDLPRWIDLQAFL